MTALADNAALGEALAAARMSGPIAPGPAPLASPSYKALDSASALVQTPGGPVFVKRIHPEMREGIRHAGRNATGCAGGRGGRRAEGALD